MGRKSELKRLAEAVRQAEAELDAATKRSDLNLAAKKLMQARQALKAAEKAAGIRWGCKGGRFLGAWSSSSRSKPDS